MNEALTKPAPQSRYQLSHRPRVFLLLFPPQSPHRSRSQAITDLPSRHERLDFSSLEVQINGIIQGTLLCVCLLSLSVFWGSIYFVAFNIVPFLFFRTVSHWLHSYSGVCLSIHLLKVDIWVVSSLRCQQ